MEQESSSSMRSSVHKKVDYKGSWEPLILQKLKSYNDIEREDYSLDLV